MADIGDFARQAADRFVSSQEGKRPDDRLNLQLPRAAVEEFVTNGYYASMIPDEGRFPSVCLMSYRKGCESDLHFLFDTPREPTPQEIAKLAHAVAPGSHLCCVNYKEKLALSGIHVTALNEMREYGYNSFRIANPLKLIIRGPGHIEMSTGGTALHYKAGAITAERLFQHGCVVGALARTVASNLEELTDGRVESLDSIFNDLAEEIVRLGHGGLLLVAKEPLKSQFSSIRKIDCLFLQQLLLRYWNDVREVQQSGGLVNLQARRDQAVVNPRALTIATDTTMLENAIKAIGHLAGMDGAIVMDFSCKVVCFNAIINRLENPLRVALVDEDGRELKREEVIKNRGSRHQAALTYAMQVPRSFAFVISQDGSVSAFHNPGDGRVICELGMRVLD